MSVCQTRTIVVASNAQRAISMLARERRITVTEAADDFFRVVLNREEPATLARIAREVGAALRARRIGIPADGLSASTIRDHVEVPSIVGHADRLVRAGDGWAWQRVSQVRRVSP